MNCAECSQSIQKGQKYFRRPSGKRVHEHCPPKKVSADAFLMENFNTVANANIAHKQLINELKGALKHLVEDAWTARNQLATFGIIGTGTLQRLAAHREQATTILERMEKGRTYWVDGEETDWRDLIRLARKFGYDPDCLHLVAEAAAVLRDNGYTVSDKPDTGD